MNMNTRRRKIIVADDYPDAADTMVELLRLAGYEAASAYDGQQALELARTFRPDLVILDIDMPVLDGYATARAFRKEQAPGSRVVLIAYTARTQPSDERDALEAGFDRHVKKPLIGQELCDLIDAYLETLGPRANLAYDDEQRETPPVVDQEQPSANNQRE